MLRTCSAASCIHIPLVWCANAFRDVPVCVLIGQHLVTAREMLLAPFPRGKTEVLYDCGNFSGSWRPLVSIWSHALCSFCFVLRTSSPVWALETLPPFGSHGLLIGWEQGGERHSEGCQVYKVTCSFPLHNQRKHSLWQYHPELQVTYEVLKF